MSPRNMVLIAGAVALAAALGGCGKLGELDRPGPLVGKGRAAATQSGGQARRSQDPAHPMSTVDPRDATTDPAPIRSVPVQGTADGAAGAAKPAPSSVIPDPYANPQ